MWDPGDGELGTQEKRGARKVQEGGGGGGGSESRISKVAGSRRNTKKFTQHKTTLHNMFQSKKGKEVGANKNRAGTGIKCMGCSSFGCPYNPLLLMSQSPPPRLPRNECNRQFLTMLDLGHFPPF